MAKGMQFRPPQSCTERFLLDWTPEAEAILAVRWKRGDTARQIAAALGRNVSRNAVIGKAFRMDLPKRPSPIRRKEGRNE